MAIKITTNHVPRDIVYGFELSDKERQEFDYYTPDELDNAEFFRYKGRAYDLGEFMRIDGHDDKEFTKWDGYMSDSFFSGILVKWPRMDYNPREIDAEHVIVGWYRA